MVFANRFAYVEALKRHNFEKVGFGAYSVVLGKPGSDKVIKVGSGDNWPQYIQWAIKNGYSGTFAPKVFSLKFHDMFYVAVMERLVCTMGDIGTFFRNPYQELVDDCRLWTGYHRGWKGNISEQADLQAFCRACGLQGFNEDLHDKNFMLRKDGQLVLIDPARCGLSPKVRIKHSTLV